MTKPKRTLQTSDGWRIERYKHHYELLDPVEVMYVAKFYDQPSYNRLIVSEGRFESIEAFDAHMRNVREFFEIVKKEIGE